MKTKLFAVCFLLSSQMASAQTLRALQNSPPMFDQESFTAESKLVELAEVEVPKSLPDMRNDPPVFDRESFTAESKLVEPAVVEVPKSLPDTPVPKTDSVKMPYYMAMFRDDPSWGTLALDQPDRSWSRAMLHPYMLGMSGVLATLTAITLIKTDKCITENKPACNLVTGKNRAAAYAFNVPLTAGLIWYSVRMKEKGGGRASLLVLFAGLTYEYIVSFTSNPHVLVCKDGRTPLCQ
jgi:hypothetical protein